MFKADTPPINLLLFLLLATFFLSEPLLAQNLNQKKETIMQSSEDEKTLSQLNARFIQNFINMDTASHNKIIHPDFICITGKGSIVNRKDYMEGWVNGYVSAGYIAFKYTDEVIRIFGNMALVIAKTPYTKQINGETV
jgi:hypothetical protein